MIVLAVVAAMLADLLTFVCAATVLNIGGEANPLARYVYVHGGLLGVVGLKAAGTLAVLVVLAALSEPWRTWAAVIIVTATLLAAGTNALAVVLSRA